MRKKVLFVLLFILGVPVFVLVLIVLDVQLKFASHIVAIGQVQPAPFALVLGASVTTKGEASDALRDRVETAIELYRQGKVQKLLMSGDDGQFHVDEVAAMVKLAQEQGIPSAAIEVDGHGYRTYESCKRAVEKYQITNAVIVTQRFHLGRALYLCTNFGMQTQGVSADRQTYARIVYFTVRDLLASVKAWWDMNIWAPQPSVQYTESTSTAL